jgi:ABC-type dipeptide/oligopeptide/nickel transport system permease component
MARYLIKKLITLLILLCFVSTAVFTVLFVLPGDPAQIILGINATPETLANLRAELGLDQSFFAQYTDWIGNIITGHGNRSITYDMPVSELILSSLAVTGPLALLAMVFAVVLSIPLGIFAARHQNRPGDVTVMFFTQLGLATPEFWLGILLILLLAVHWGLFASGGFPGWAADFWGSLKALLNPFNPLLYARSSKRRLHPNRQSQRPKGKNRHLCPCAQKCPDTGIDNSRSAAGAASCRSHYYRKRFLPSRHGQIGFSGNRPTRSAGG